MDGNESDRLARLEREMTILRSEFARLREHIGGLPPVDRPVGAAPPPPPPRPAPPPPSAAPQSSAPPFQVSPRRPGPSVEQLIGRYGTIAVATVTVLVAVGMFLSWAIQKHILGPEARVILGYIAAAALAAGGIRLRQRGTREFGNVLMAMALGVVHLVCWEAGPNMHVMPSWAALMIGFVASAVLAEFALRHDEEMLCAVGFGGAAIAPFITSDNSGNLIALAAYGAAVVALSAAAIGDRPWRTALNVTMIAFILYVVATATGHQGPTSWLWIASRLGILFPLIVLLAIIPFTDARHRRALVRVVGLGVVVGIIGRAHRGPDPWSLVLTIGAAVLIIGVLDVMRPGALEGEAATASADNFAAKRNARLDALILPLALFVAAIAAAPSWDSMQSAAVAMLWTALAIYMTHRTRGEPEADMFASTASVTALVIAPAALADHEVARVFGLVPIAIGLFLLALRMARQPFAVGGIAGMVLASLWALRLVTQREKFTYLPFGTAVTAAAVIAILGWVAGYRISCRADFLSAVDETARASLRRFAISGAGVTAFFWGHGELVGA